MDVFLEYLATAGAIIFVFVALGFCILSHELGHFLAGKLMGLHIDAFSLGFRPIWRKKYKGVEYRIGWLPLGGYVELPQVDASDEVPKSADGRELPPASPKARIVTAVAGPLFNIISGLLLGCIVWAAGIPEITPKMREITVLSVPENSPEFAAGLRKGDVIVKLNGEKFHDTWENFIKKILFTINAVTLEVERGGETLQISYIPAENPNAPGGEKIAYPFFKPLLPVKLYPQTGKAADKAGIKNGDIVLAVDGQEIVGAENFLQALGFSQGKAVTVELLREGRKVSVSLTPELESGKETIERYLAGITMVQKENGIEVASLMAGGSAGNAGIRKGDMLIAGDGRKVTALSDLPEIIAAKKGAPVVIRVLREGKELEFTVTPRKFLALKSNPGAPAYFAGVSFAAYNHPNPIELFIETIDMSWKSLRGIATTIGNKLNLTESRSSLKPSHMSSTLGIGMVLYTSIRTSWSYGIYFMVVISFALALFNLLPFPVLDGGHILFGFLEWITGKRVPSKVMKVISVIFVTLLIALTLYITFFDGKRLWRKISGNKSIPAVKVEKNAPQNP